MTRMYKKTKERVQFIKDKFENGYSKLDIREKFMDKFDTQEHAFYECWSYFKYGHNGRSDRDKLIKEEKINTKKFFNEPNQAYFGGKGKLVPHHISYVPEVIVHLSASNHKRLHILIEEYHKQILEKDSKITKLNKKIEEISKIIGM